MRFLHHIFLLLPFIVSLILIPAAWWYQDNRPYYKEVQKNGASFRLRGSTQGNSELSSMHISWSRDGRVSVSIAYNQDIRAATKERRDYQKNTQIQYQVDGRQWQEQWIFGRYTAVRHGQYTVIMRPSHQFPSAELTLRSKQFICRLKAGHKLTIQAALPNEATVDLVFDLSVLNSKFKELFLGLCGNNVQE